MTPQKLINNLRNAINPAYAHQIGTESYERKLCAETMEALLNECNRLEEICVVVHGKLLRGDDDRESLDLLATAWKARGEA